MCVLWYTHFNKKCILWFSLHWNLTYRVQFPFPNLAGTLKMPQLSCIKKPHGHLLYSIYHVMKFSWLYIFIHRITVNFPIALASIKFIAYCRATVRVTCLHLCRTYRLVLQFRSLALEAVILLLNHGSYQSKVYVFCIICLIRHTHMTKSNYSRS